MTFKNRLTNINPAPGAGITSVLTLACGPTAPTLDKIQLILAGGGGAFDASKINKIRGFMNQRQFYAEGSGTVHNARDAYKGVNNVASQVVLDFTEPNARSAIEQMLTSIPLSQCQDLRFEFDLDATSGAAPTIDAVMLFRAPTKNPFVKKQFSLTQGFQAGGEQIVYVPNGNAGGKLLRMWIHEGVAGNITKVELRAKNATGVEASRVQLQNEQRRNGLTPQAGVLVLDFIEDGNLAGWFDTSMLSDVQLRLTGTAADTYTIYLEYADPIGRL
jgi:hypothetical protein